MYDKTFIPMYLNVDLRLIHPHNTHQGVSGVNQTKCCKQKSLRSIQIRRANFKA